MSEKILPFLCGLVVGVGGALVVILAGGEESGKTDDLKVSKLREEKSALEEKLHVARLENEAFEERLVAVEAERVKPAEAPAAGAPAVAEPAVEPVAKSKGPPTEEELEKALEAYVRSLGAVIQGGGEEAKKRLRAFFERVTEEQIAKLFERFKATDGIPVKIGLAHALAQSGRPEAIEMLTELVRDHDLGFLERRFASHGLAFADDDSLVPLLGEVARGDPDLGARANAAFGLARRGLEDGVELYARLTDEAFEAKDPVALQYLGGFMLLGEKGLPAVRERLKTYEDKQAQMLLLEVVKATKDRESLPILQGIVDDPDADKSVRESARNAIRAIEGN
ncbi:MAG: HEAT repeat domain-containing protein [Planctomycetota bacterium]|jgi:HEAT repeat protein